MKIFRRFKEMMAAVMSGPVNVAKFIGRLLKWVWRVCELALIGIIVIFAFAFFTDKRCYYRISSRYHIYEYSTLELYRIKDVRNDKWVSGWLNSIDTNLGSDSLLYFSKPRLFDDYKLYGYIDANTGKVAIEPQFLFAGTFSEGLAAARKDGKVGFINTNGEFVVTVDKGVCNIREVQMNGGCAILNVGGNNGYGILSHKGEWVVEPEWSDIQEVGSGLYIISAGCYDGLWSVSKGWICNVEYDSIKISKSGEKLLTVVKDGWSWQIDANGAVVNKFVFDAMDNLYYNKEGENAEISTTSEFAVYYIADNSGLFHLRTRKAVTPAIYSSIDMVSENLFVVSICNGESHLIDSKGNVVGDKSW